MKSVWVIGANGLLGSALCALLRGQGARLYVPPERLDWSDPERLHAQVEANVAEFAAYSTAAACWEIYWAAGIGTMASTEDALTRETDTLAFFLALLGREHRISQAAGSISFASSAGAIYAGVEHGIISESTTVAPTTAYAHAKLEQEATVCAFAATHASVRVLIARFSTLYGVGQASGKQQGLLTHIARNIVRNEPVHIYVPFDTIRDYISVSDAAARMVSATRGMLDKQVTKIIAAERPTTVAQIVSIFKRMARRRPRIVTSANQQSKLYKHRIEFRSHVAIGGVDIPLSSLEIGMAQLLEAERERYTRAMQR